MAIDELIKDKKKLKEKLLVIRESNTVEGLDSSLEDKLIFSFKRDSFKKIK